MTEGTSFGGKYELLQRLGAGGMAEIFLARVRGLEGFEKHLVIKRILPMRSADEAFVEMFLDEARLAARLHHQNIVQVYDIGLAEDSYFFSMEYVHGVDVRTLRAALNEKGLRLPIQHALTIAAGVASGLDYAHNLRGPEGRELEVVHRDVSPSNIMVTYNGGVKLLDFGIARARERVTTTRAGHVKGKISYMSPEQCRSEEIDGRSDIFSLGVVLYELTTMTRLFSLEGTSDYLVMHRIVTGDVPPPSTRVDGYPSGLEQIVMRALAPARQDRYQSARDLLVDLEAVATEMKQPVSASSLAEFLVGTLGREPEPWIESQEGRAPDRLPLPAPPPTQSIASASVFRSEAAPGAAEQTNTLVTPPSWPAIAALASDARSKPAGSRRWLWGAVLAAAVAGAIAVWILFRGSSQTESAGSQPAAGESAATSDAGSARSLLEEHLAAGHDHSGPADAGASPTAADTATDAGAKPPRKAASRPSKRRTGTAKRAPAKQKRKKPSKQKKPAPRDLVDRTW